MKAETNLHNAPPMFTIYINSDWHIGIEAHFCKQCGGFLKLYLLKLVIEIPFFAPAPAVIAEQDAMVKGFAEIINRAKNISSAEMARRQEWHNYEIAIREIKGMSDAKLLAAIYKKPNGDPSLISNKTEMQQLKALLQLLIDKDYTEI